MKRRRVRRGSDDASTASDTEIKKLETECVVNEGRAKLHALERDSDALKVRIEAAEKTNANELTELRQKLQLILLQKVL